MNQKTYKVGFIGKNAGAIGISHRIYHTLRGDFKGDKEAIRMALYNAGYEHIQSVYILDISQD